MGTDRIPKITVIATTYNHERYIGKFIDSVKMQTLDDIEVIVSDDCSTDQTYEIMKSCKHPRIHIRRNEENLGINKHLNCLLPLAKGQYIHVMSGDDAYLCRESLKIIAKHLKNDPEVDYFAFGKSVMNSKSELCRNEKLSTDQRTVYLKMNGKKAVKKLLTGKIPFHLNQQVVFKKELIIKDGQITEFYENTNPLGYGDDADYYNRILMKANKFEYIDTPLVLYRSHESSATNTLNASGEGYYIHNKMLHSWIRMERYVPLRFYEKWKIMGGDYVRVFYEAPRTAWKHDLLRNYYSLPEKLFAWYFIIFIKNVFFFFSPRRMLSYLKRRYLKKLEVKGKCI